MCTEVREEGFRKERTPRIRTSQDRARVKNLLASKRDEYEEVKKRESVKTERKREKEGRENGGENAHEKEIGRRIFEISSRKMIAYLRARYRRYVRFRLTRLMTSRRLISP